MGPESTLQDAEPLAQPRTFTLPNSPSFNVRTILSPCSLMESDVADKNGSEDLPKASPPQHAKDEPKVRLYPPRNDSENVISTTADNTQDALFAAFRDLNANLKRLESHLIVTPSKQGSQWRRCCSSDFSVAENLAFAFTEDELFWGNDRSVFRRDEEKMFIRFYMTCYIPAHDVVESEEFFHIVYMDIRNTVSEKVPAIITGL